MSAESIAKQVVNKMKNNDPFSKWLGIECLEIESGKASLQMIVRKDMLNGFGIAHGGISYALADSALAFASNSLGRMSVWIETSISHTETVKEGDVLTATTEELSLTNKFAVYQIIVKNQQYKNVALFKGTVYRTNKEWAL